MTEERKRLRIESDGTGAGTRITLDGVLVDGVQSLTLEVAGRASRVKVTMVCDVDVVLDAYVVTHGNPWAEKQIVEQEKLE